MSHFEESTYERRIDRMRAAMAEQRIELAILPASADLEYLSGLDVKPSERFTALVLPVDGDPALVCPAFEAPRLAGEGVVERLLPWREEEDPFRLVKGIFQRRRDLSRPAMRIALGGALPFDFYLRLQDVIRSVDRDAHFTSAAGVLGPIRMRKDPEEVEWMRESLARTRERIFQAGREAAGGATEAVVSAALSTDLPSPNFALVLYGAHAAEPHGVSGDRALADGEPVLIDAGGRGRGYWTDITRTFLPEGHARAEEIWRVVLEAQEAGFATAAPGVEAQEVDRAARAVIEKAGLGEHFTHRLGHGIGLEGHEPPYLVEGNRLPLEPGMTVTIEPGVYIPGDIGVRIEDVCVITEGGCESLSERDLEPTWR